MRATSLISAGTLLLAACGGEAPCVPPTGCLAAERLRDACACTEWATVATETVALPYVVASLRYWPAGTASVFRYGETSNAEMVPQSDSRSGTTVRAVIRGPNGSEQVARVGTVGEYAQVQRASDTTLRVASGTAVWTLTSDLDLPDAAGDWIAVWTNPSITLRTDYSGRKIVDWSWSPTCHAPLSCFGAEYIIFSVALLRGDVWWTDWHDAYLTAVGPEARAALLAFDPRAAGVQPDFPRYERLAYLSVHPDETRMPESRWYPCAHSADFEVLAETAVSLADGDTFVLQYGVQSDGSCSPQQPGLVVGTSTAGCSFSAPLYVDRLAGVLLAVPDSASAECTRS